MARIRTEIVLTRS